MAFVIPTRTTTTHLLLLCITSITFLIAQCQALQYVPGSPCASVCDESTAGSLSDDVVCLNDSFETQPGLFFKNCVSCELNSTAVDPATNMTDVQWALYNLRYTLSNCMFAVPTYRVSISTPCQVTCDPLKSAITYNITNSTDISSTLAEYNYCTAGYFDDTAINNCAFCYSFVPQQLFLGNFLQALHIACRSPPALGHAFYPDGRTIFNASTIAGPTAAKHQSAPASGLTGWKLAIAIALPIVGGLVLTIAVCYGCFHFTRKRRQRMAASGRMSRFYDNQNVASGGGYSPVTSKGGIRGSQYGWNEPPREMERIDIMAKHDMPAKNSPGLAQGRWSQHFDDEADMPLTNAHPNTSFTTAAGPAVGQIQDPALHEHFIGVAHGGGPGHSI